MPFTVRKGVYYFLAALFLTTLLGLGWVVTQLRDMEALKALVSEQMAAITHRQVTIGRAEVTWENGIGLSLHQVSLGDAKDPAPVFSAERVGVSLGLWRLLRGSVEISKILVEGARLQVTRKPGGDWVWEGLGAPIALAGIGKKNPIKEWGPIRRLDLKNGTVIFLDQGVTAGNPVRLEAHNVDLTISRPFFQSLLLLSAKGEMNGALGPAAPFEVNGRYHSGGGRSAAAPALDGTLRWRGVNVAWLGPYLDRVFGLPPSAGSISGDSIFAGTPGGTWSARGILTLAPGPPAAGAVLSAALPQSAGAVEFDVGWEKDTLQFKSLKYRNGNFDIDAKGAYSQLAGASRRRVEFQVTSSAFTVEDSQGILPFMLFHQKTHDEFHQRFQKGRMQIQTLQFEGSLDQLNHLSDPENLNRMTADLALLGVDFGPALQGLKGVQGTLRLQKGVSDIQIRKAHYEQFAISNLTGRITDVIGRPVVNWKVDGRFDLSAVKRTLRKMMGARSFEKQLNLVHDLKGAGQVHLSFQGPLQQPERLRVQGSMDLENASFRPRHLKQPFENVAGRILFTNHPETAAAEDPSGAPPWEVKLEGFSGRLGDHQITGLGAVTTVQKKTRVRRVFATVKLGLLEAAKLVSQPLLGRFQSYLKDITFAGGEVTLDFRAEADPLALEPRGPLGLVELRKVSVKHLSGYGPLIDVSGFLYFDKNKIRLKTTEAWYGDSPVEIKGQYLNIHSADPELVVRASSDRFKHTDFAGVPFLEKLVYQGPAKVEFIWQSNNENRKFENHVDLQRVAYSYGDYFSKPAGAANRIVVKGRVLPQGGLALDDVIFELEGNRVTGHAKVDNPEDPTFAAHLESKDFETLKAAPFIHALASNRGGRMEFILDGTGRVRDLENGKLRGTAFLRQLEFKPEGFVHPFTLDAEVKWSEDLYDIREGALSSDRTHVDFSGRYKNGLKPHLDLVLTGKELNLEHLLPEESGTGQGKGASRWRTTRLFAQGSGSFDLRLDRFDYGVWSLPQVVGKVAFKDRVLQFEQLDVGKEKVNQVRAQGSVTFAPSQPAVFEGLFLAYNVQAEGFFGHFGNLFEKSLSGRLNWLKARVNSRGDSLQEVLDNLEGNLSVDLSDGFIQTARLREGARRLFEFPGEDAPVSLDEPAHSYIDIFGDFEVKSGVAHTENFLYEDKNKRLSLVGDFDLNRYAMDTVVGVAPLRELDRVLTKIPLVGKIITAGDEQSLFKNYYRVRGPFKDPDVSPVPFTSLGKKVIGIFQGILQAPTELFPPPAISRNRPSLPAPRP